MIPTDPIAYISERLTDFHRYKEFLNISRLICWDLFKIWWVPLEVSLDPAMFWPDLADFDQFWPDFSHFLHILAFFFFRELDQPLTSTNWYLSRLNRCVWMLETWRGRVSFRLGTNLTWTNLWTALTFRISHLEIIVQSFRACLVCDSKQQFSLFKYWKLWF